MEPVVESDPVVAPAALGVACPVRLAQDGVVARATVWEGELTAAERVALRPGVPVQLSRRPDVLVVGSGVIGLATAVACRRAGLGSVVVVEQAERLASAASARASATTSA